MSSIVEDELYREFLYSKILRKLSEDLKPLKFKEISHLLLRYVFNLITERDDSDDPVFILKESNIAIEQLKGDFEYFRIRKDYILYNKKIQKYFKQALIDFKVYKDKNIIDEEINIDNKGLILYKNMSFVDISDLASKFPNYANHALALNIRYNYLKLTTHGLARDFKGMGLKKNDATEAFGSAFNHYFDEYCSAFSDLESVFGSKGSFFTMQDSDWKTKIIYVNPPFDATLISFIIDRVKSFKKKINNTFIFTLPNWNDFPALDGLKKEAGIDNSIVYKKNGLAFIDYMEQGKIIFPCDIAEITLK